MKVAVGLLKQLEYFQLEKYHLNSPAIQLLRSRNAAFIISFLYEQFQREPKPSLRYIDLRDALSRYLDQINQYEPDRYLNSADHYLNQWTNENQWLRIVRSDVPDDHAVELTVHTQRVLGWMEELQQRTFVGTESRFLQILTLLEEFKTQTSWTERVTDVRRWLDFAAEELSLSDGSHRQRYDSSSGKSGGQKAKLAYTILASAVAYQYGLFTDSQDIRKTFRFVVVDEVFSKSDESNSRFAMDLFQKLNLQVLVVTPSDKLHIVEDYIGTCHFVWNKNGDDSKIVTMPMEKLKEMQASKEGNRYDYTQ